MAAIGKSSGEEGLVRYPGESARDFGQRRTFLGWLNHVLSQEDIEPIADPITDLTDGVALGHLYQSITGKELKGIDPKAKNNKMKCISNLTIVLQAMAADGVSLTNIGPQDIYDKNYSLIMGFLWKVVRRYHLGLFGQESAAGEESEENRLKKKMIDFTNRRLKMVGEDLNVQNLTTDFQNGRAITGIVASFDKTFLSVLEQNLPCVSSMRRAFAQSQMVCAIPPVLSAIDVSKNPDEKAIMTYLAYFMKLEESLGVVPSDGHRGRSASGTAWEKVSLKSSGSQDHKSIQIGRIDRRANSKPIKRRAAPPPPPPPLPKVRPPPPPPRTPLLPLHNITFSVVENGPSMTGQQKQLIIKVCPKDPSSFDYSQLGDLLHMGQIKVKNADGDICPFQFSFLGGDDSSGGDYEVRFVPNLPGGNELVVVDGKHQVVFQKTLQNVAEGEMGQANQFSPLNARQTKFATGNESNMENPHSPKQSRVSFFGGSVGTPVRKSQTTISLDELRKQISEAESQKREEESSGAPPSRVHREGTVTNEGAARPQFARTETTNSFRALKVYLDDDPELDAYGLRRACITVRYEGMSMRAVKLKELVKEKMCSKLEKDSVAKLRDYVQFYVIVELCKNGEQRVVGKCEPLDRWQVGGGTIDSRLMYLPVMGHYDFLVDYPLTRVSVGEQFYVRIDCTDPFRLGRTVQHHNGYLALVLTSKVTGIQVEYEAEYSEGTHVAATTFATPGRYNAMVQFNGHDVQSRNALVRVGKGKPVFRFQGLKTKHKKKEVKEQAAPSFPRSFHSRVDADDRE
mmetsp:Transcript_22130/g.30398  ORF Transcript_22130/g.30398 Transcript_22130/m.30398 type:complete len:797 (+) Transcript_22130:28-2418(+)